MKSFIIGASSGVGRAIAYRLAKSGNDLILLASDSRDLISIKKHLELLYRVKVQIMPYYLDNNNDLLYRIYSEAASFGDINNLFFPIGISLDSDNDLLKLNDIDRLISTNLIVIIKLCTLFLTQLKDKKKSNIIFFSSIATIRGRDNNIVYSSAKCGLESYFESIRHALASKETAVSLYCLGYVETSLSFGKKLLFPKISPETVANKVVKNLNKSVGKKFIPNFWLIVELIIKIMPWCIYKQIKY